METPRKRKRYYIKSCLNFKSRVIVYQQLKLFYQNQWIWRSVLDTGANIGSVFIYVACAKPLLYLQPQWLYRKNSYLPTERNIDTKTNHKASLFNSSSNVVSTMYPTRSQINIS